MRFKRSSGSLWAAIFFFLLCRAIDSVIARLCMFLLPSMWHNILDMWSINNLDCTRTSQKESVRIWADESVIRSNNLSGLFFAIK